MCHSHRVFQHTCLIALSENSGYPQFHRIKRLLSVDRLSQCKPQHGANVNGLV